MPKPSALIPLTLLTLLALCLPAAAQPWRYVDKKGRVNYTNNINNLPPKLRKKAREFVERKKLRAATKAAAEAAAAPPSGSPAGVPSIAVPAPPSATAQSAESKSKEPTAHDKWTVKVGEADKAVADLALDLKRAQDSAQAAQRKALLTPTGFNSAAHLKAQKRLKSVESQLTAAQAVRVRTRKAEPPVTQ